MLSRALRPSATAQLVRGFCVSPQAAEVGKEVVEKDQTNGQAQAAISPEQFLTRVFGSSRVPRIVRERLLVTYFGQQQAQQQLHQSQQEELRNKLEHEMRERARWEVSAAQVQDLKNQAQNLMERRTHQLLVLKGCMNLRGLLEFVEDEAKRFGAPTNKKRPELWEWILRQKPELVKCITAATTWKQSVIPVKIQSLYDTLNKHHHVGKTPVEWTAVGGLRIEEGEKLSILDCRLLHCVCESHGIKAEVVRAADDLRIHDSNMHEE